MSTIKANQWLNSDGTENYKCRAWVNFNGTGTVAIRASGNVSSITDNGTGDYTVNFTNALADANYSVETTCLGPTAEYYLSVVSMVAASVRFNCFKPTVGIGDSSIACVSVHR